MTIPKITIKRNNIVTSSHTKFSQTISVGADPALTQIVVAAGPNSDWEVGDIVEINKYSIRNSRVAAQQSTGDKIILHWPKKEINGEEYLFLSDTQIEYALDAY